jgi:lysophospholipase L1-like esterase
MGVQFMNEKQESTINAAKLDKNMEYNSSDGQDIIWFNPLTNNTVSIAGFPWIEKEKIYRRLPSDPAYNLPVNVSRLANCTAGGQLRFRTDSAGIYVKVGLTGKANMDHMPATGQCGVDCYVKLDGKYRFVGVTRFNHALVEYECKIFECSERSIKEYLLNMPLYQGVKYIYVGIDKGAAILLPEKLRKDGRVIFYGTSITQGGCASRPGMAYTNILSRMLDVECINLGFSGSGKGEPEVAKVIAEIEQPICYVLDYQANCTNTLMFDTFEEFIRILRKDHPTVPILAVSMMKNSRDLLNPVKYSDKKESALFQSNVVKKLKDTGDKNIYFYDGEELFGDNFDECTVDGIHPTDMGFWKMAEKLAPVIEKIIF